MIAVMACKVTGPRPVAAVLKPKLVISVRQHDRRVEVYQVCIAARVSLREADAVRVVADAAGRGVFVYVRTVL